MQPSNNSNKETSQQMTPDDALRELTAGGYGEERLVDRGGYVVPERHTQRKKGGRMGGEGGSLLIDMLPTAIAPERNPYFDCIHGTAYRMLDANVDSNSLKNPFDTTAPRTAF